MEDNKNNTNNMKSIEDILNYTFTIHDYQRGYRWRKTDVDYLLNDINSSNEGYILQVITVRKEGENKYELIDGQQRLTTIWMILKYLGKNEAEKLNTYLIESKNNTYLRESKNNYTLIYTKVKNENSEGFYNNIIDNYKVNTPDEYFIINAWKTIENFFKIKTQDFIESFIVKLLQAKIIWYEVNNEVNNNTDSNTIFKNLNQNKIPLNDAELIKAEILRNKNKNTDKQQLNADKQQLYALQWNNIENTLQDDSLWYFLSANKKTYSTRILLLFEYIALTLDGKENNEHLIYNKLKDKDKFNDLDKLWKEVLEIYNFLLYLYHDHTLYHLCGYYFYINDTKSAVKLIKECKIIDEEKEKSKVKEKSEVVKIIKDKIKNSIFDEKKEKIEEKISNLNYDDNKIDIRKILLLTDIAIILNSKMLSYRFRFDLYKKDCWDVEHIKARNVKGIKDFIIEISTQEENEDKKKDFLVQLGMLEKEEKEEEENVKGKWKKFTEFIASGMHEELKQIINPNKEDETKQEWEKLKEWEELKNWANNKKSENNNYEVKEDNGNINSICNLCLLNADINREKKYSNAPFIIKHLLIKKNMKEGRFIPLNTQNVFLKFYNDFKYDNNNFNWNCDTENNTYGNTDGDNYQKAIIHNISKLLLINKEEKK